MTVDYEGSWRNHAARPIGGMRRVVEVQRALRAELGLLWRVYALPLAIAAALGFYVGAGHGAAKYRNLLDLPPGGFAIDGTTYYWKRFGDPQALFWKHIPSPAEARLGTFPKPPATTPATTLPEAAQRKRG